MTAAKKTATRKTKPAAAPKRVTRTARTTSKASSAKPEKRTRAAKPKAAPKPKAEIQRVPAETFVAELQRLGLTKSAAARALGVSPSLVSEWSGSGRSQLMAADRWDGISAKLAAAAE